LGSAEHESERIGILSDSAEFQQKISFLALATNVQRHHAGQDQVVSTNTLVIANAR
jgi:hypothetical protein